MAAETNLDVWYTQIPSSEIRGLISGKSRQKKFDKNVKKAHGRNSLRSLRKLTETVDGRLRIRSDPPLLIPLRDMKKQFLTRPTSRSSSLPSRSIAPLSRPN